MNCLYKQREATNLKSSVTTLKTLSFPNFKKNHNKMRIVAKTNKKTPCKIQKDLLIHLNKRHTQ